MMSLNTIFKCLFITVGLFPSVSALTCLGCDNVIQPRHCHNVARCQPGEICGAETYETTTGYMRYKLGCVKQNDCPNGNMLTNGTYCRQCCSSTLCNSAVCGEQGYPSARGPICYDCPYHNNEQPCKTISFCSETEECSLVSQEEFGDTILTSGCKQQNLCPSSVVPLVGKRSAFHLRSGNHILCSKCCAGDLCNLNCTDGGWSEWSYSVCSHTCGNGIRIRIRTCMSSYPNPDGYNCSGPAYETEACNTTPCSVEGSWSEWSNWTDCSISCGSGKQFRVRVCNFPAGIPHGNNCTGKDTEERNCNSNRCPVDGKWSQWTSWRGCTVTCGSGVRQRYRTCSYVPSAPHGRICAGNTTETATCTAVTDCPVDGVWEQWGGWSACSQSCGGGVQLRRRTCSFPPRVIQGDYCPGQGTGRQDCNTGRCLGNSK